MSDRESFIVECLERAFSDLMEADPDAFRTKFRKMAADPFAFYRGSACVFYADLDDREDRWADERTGRFVEVRKRLAISRKPVTLDGAELHDIEELRGERFRHAERIAVGERDDRAARRGHHHEIGRGTRAECARMTV